MGRLANGCSMEGGSGRVWRSSEMMLQGLLDKIGRGISAAGGEDALGRRNRRETHQSVSSVELLSAMVLCSEMEAEVKLGDVLWGRGSREGGEQGVVTGGSRRFLL
jgi:hypothetical protein